MGDSHNDTVRVDFDRQLKLEFHGLREKGLVRWAQAATGRVPAGLFGGENRCNLSFEG